MRMITRKSNGSISMSGRKACGMFSPDELRYYNSISLGFRRYLLTSAPIETHLRSSIPRPPFSLVPKSHNVRFHENSSPPSRHSSMPASTALSPKANHSWSSFLKTEQTCSTTSSPGCTQDASTTKPSMLWNLSSQPTSGFSTCIAWSTSSVLKAARMILSRKLRSWRKKQIAYLHQQTRGSSSRLSAIRSTTR